MSTHLAGRLARTAVGCLGYTVVCVVLAGAIDRWVGGRVVPGARPWLGAAAALCFTLALGVVWSWVMRLARGGESRPAILARAAAGDLPASDGPAVVSGRVRPSGAPLHAPLSGTACVAYMYRMYYETEAPTRRRRIEVPVYWGFACRPFLVDTPAHAVRVLAVPRLVDTPQRRGTAEDAERARQHVAATRFEEASGLLGAAATAFATAGTMFCTDDGEERRDWKATGTARDPGTLLLEETVLPVGASAAVAGAWLSERRAIVPSTDASGSPVVTVTTGPVETLLSKADVAPPSGTSAFAWTLVLLGLGVGILVAGLRLLAPGA